MCAGCYQQPLRSEHFDLDVNKVRQLKAKNLKIFATLSDLISLEANTCAGCYPTN